MVTGSKAARDLWLGYDGPDKWLCWCLGTGGRSKNKSKGW